MDGPNAAQDPIFTQVLEKLHIAGFLTFRRLGRDQYQVLFLEFDEQHEPKFQLVPIGRLGKPQRMGERLAVAVFHRNQS